MAEYISLKNRSEDEQPREKLLQHGKEVLSNSELLGILIGTGTKKNSAIDLGRNMLKLANNDLNQLAKLSVAELCTIDGIGPAKAVTIAAAIELGGRQKRADITQLGKIRCSKDAYQYFYPMLEHIKHEEFWMLLLKQSNQIIQAIKISSGGVSGTVADPKVIYKKALEQQASALVFCHNHPSGNLIPSQSDLNLTKKLVEAGKMLDIRIVDHIIVAETGYYSFADEGLV